MGVARHTGTPQDARNSIGSPKGKQALRVVGIISSENNEPPHENRLLLDDPASQPHTASMVCTEDPRYTLSPSN
jgi:hypothetical protein